MWSDIRWRMRGIKPSDQVYHQMKKSLLDSWAADKQVWLRGREAKESKRREETDRGETTFSIRDLRGMMEEAVEHKTWCKDANNLSFTKEKSKCLITYF